MSIFTEPYSDPPGGIGSAGPRLGLMAAFEAAYDSQVRNWSILGLHRAFEEVEEEQLKLIRERAGSLPDVLRLGPRAAGYRAGEVARYFEQGGPPEIAEWIAGRDAELEKLRGQIPELRTYRELWEEVKSRAGRAEDRWEGGSTTWPGMVGGFLGGAVGAVDPRTDPINTLSMGVAPGLQTVARRLAMAAGGNAAVETINQLTGVQANRELLGLENSVGQAIQQILFAGTVGAGFQGAGEVVVAGVRRLRAPQIAQQPPGTGFALVGEPYGPLSPSRPPAVSDRAAFADPRPLSPAALNDIHIRELWPDAESFVQEVRAPWAETRFGRRRMQAELNRTILHMQRFDVDGLPDMPPRSATALQQPVTRAGVEAPWWIRDQAEVANEMARYYDPELFRHLDLIDRQITALRSRAEELRVAQQTPRARAADEELDRVQDIERQIARLRDQADGADRRKAKRIEREIARLNAMQREMLARIKDDATQLSATQIATADVAQRLNLLTQVRQELTPLQRHAESVARDEMALHMPATDVLMLFDRLVGYGVDISPRVAQRTDEMKMQRSATHGASQQPTDEMKMQRGETPAEMVVRTTREAAEQTDDGTVLIQRAKQALADAEEKAAKGEQVDEPTIDLGYGPMRLDQEVIVGTALDEAGRPVAQTKTWRQILKDIDEDESMVQVMTTCAKE